MFLPIERVFGYIIGGMGGHFSVVRYVKGGIDYEVLMENNDFELMEDGIIGYDE